MLGTSVIGLVLLDGTAEFWFKVVTGSSEPFELTPVIPCVLAVTDEIVLINETFEASLGIDEILESEGSFDVGEATAPGDEAAAFGGEEVVSGTDKEPELGLTDVTLEGPVSGITGELVLGFTDEVKDWLVLWVWPFAIVLLTSLWDDNDAAAVEFNLTDVVNVVAEHKDIGEMVSVPAGLYDVEEASAVPFMLAVEEIIFTNVQDSSWGQLLKGN